MEWRYVIYTRRGWEVWIRKMWVGMDMVGMGCDRKVRSPYKHYT